eukprot:TRINITY_DN1417_c0_g1_i10.p1 TRINITY_DN1417_c0_g1~~TRINITY_DN1417_c0_g1_i10.p1  ORF type:complete len:329 (+),score=70.70 TRINITY_DN1417_c0_g1_i10:27-989(+)
MYDFYNAFVGNDGRPYAAVLSKSTQTFTTPAGVKGTKNVVKIVTPRVAQAAREQFNCPTLDGLELEDYGGAGTTGSHWEMCQVGEEYMAGFSNPLMPISKLTLALFEDSGFYTVNYSNAEPLAWGRGAGCTFAEGRCESSWPGAPYFCTDSNLQACNAGRSAIGQCNLASYGAALPPFFQHFPNSPEKGGRIPAPDYCPYVQGYKNAYCQDEGNAAQVPILGGKFGPDSMCFEGEAAGVKGAACFAHSCADGKLSVSVGGSTLPCPDVGGNVTVVLGASIRCPPAAEVCNPLAYLSAWPRYVRKGAQVVIVMSHRSSWSP